MMVDMVRLGGEGLVGGVRMGGGWRFGEVASFVTVCFTTQFWPSIWI